MEHLTLEALARLVDDPPTADEKSHLALCAKCRVELGEIEEGVRALAALRPLRSPARVWTGVEAGLAAVGFNGEGSPGRSVGHGRAVGGSNGWMRTAAALLLFAGGAAAGWGAASAARSTADEGSAQPATEADEADAPPAGPMLAAGPLEEAEQLVFMTGELYREAFSVYRERLENSGGLVVADPVGRYMALGNVLAATQEAVRLAPTDPFLNGILISTTVERDAALQGISFLGPTVP